MSGTMLKLDHVAIAAPDHRPVLDALVRRLGAVILSGGTPPKAGFRAMQVRVGRGLEGMTVEVLEPHEPEHNDFLVRFLEASGPGVHHLTFKTPDVRAEKARLERIGIDPIGVNFEGGWQEMFIHPKHAHGTVIQIAQSDSNPPPMDEWLAMLPEAVQVFDGDGPWWVTPDVEPEAVATIDRVVIRTPDLTTGHLFYDSVLGGSVDGAEISWDGGTVLLEDGPSRAHVSRIDMHGAPSTEIAGVSFVNRTG